MKKVYTIIFTALISASMFGQSIQRTVFNSTGGYISSGPGSMGMVISVGEAVVGVVENKAAGLSQGFLTGGKSIVTIPASGVQETSAIYGTVYPNPFTNSVYIRSDESNMQVSVINLMGQEVYQGLYTDQGIDLSQLPTGMYMVKASVNEKSIINTKILK